MVIARQVVAFGTGIVFAIGLGLSGMTQPQKVIGFLDIFGYWDPALVFVMLGAIAFHSISFRLVMRRTSPILSERFMVPNFKHIDTRLILGAAIFGVGWGIGGYCPGPALTSLASMQSESFIFVGSMLTGMGIFRLVQIFTKK